MKKVDPIEASQGSFTDFNVWDYELTQEQMRNFTKCVKIMKGNLIPWNIENWMMTPSIAQKEYKVENIEFNEICSSSKNKITVFLEHQTIQASMQLCQSFGGTLIKTETRKDYEEVKFPGKCSKLCNQGN